MNTAADGAGKLKVFISYSRNDMAFADELADGLEYSDFEVMMDRHSILEGEDWKKRLGSLIADSDTVVFIVSPDSCSSDLCSWEIQEAHRLSKRLLPIYLKAGGQVPAMLAALNYVRFDQGGSFMAGLRALSRALRSDVDWLREHTRLLARAMEWDAGGRNENRLLSGQDIEAAQAWAARRPKDAPEPTPLHLEFVRESAQAQLARQSEERKRVDQLAAATTAREQALQSAEAASRRVVQRTLAGLIVALLFAVAAGGFGFYAIQQRAIAEEQAEQARNSRTLAEEQRSIAEQQTRLAKRQRDLLAPGPLTETTLGDRDAPIVMIEYSSMTCSHCGSYHANTFPKIKEQYIDKGLILYISREFPLDNLSVYANMIARCHKAASFDTIQSIFREQQAWVADEKEGLQKLYSLVKTLPGFSDEEFRKCVADEALLKNLLWIRERGEKLGVNATPTFFINDQTVEGNVDFSKFEAAFAKYLPKK
jgi:protein-disulfide isomerase